MLVKRHLSHIFTLFFPVFLSIHGHSFGGGNLTDLPGQFFQEFSALLMSHKILPCQLYQSTGGIIQNIDKQLVPHNRLCLLRQGCGESSPFQYLFHFHKKMPVWGVLLKRGEPDALGTVRKFYPSCDSSRRPEGGRCL